MYLSTITLVLAASSASATAIIAQRAAPAYSLFARDITQGWSVQAPATTKGLTSCGNGSYCPSSLTCNPAANDEVAACCSSSSDCRGQVEGAPACADSSWNLYVGYMGNGFCCEAGLVGVYESSQSVAGTCVASGDVGSYQTAVLTSTGTGAAATSSASSASTASTSATTMSAASSASESSASSKSSASSTASTGATTTPSSSANASSSATSSPTAASASKNAGERVSMGIGMMGAAFLVAMAAL